MNKIYITIYLLLLGMPLAGQTDQAVGNLKYDIFEIDEDLQSKESLSLDLNGLQAVETLSVKGDKPSFVNFPFHGQVRLDEERIITHLNVIDPIKKYGAKEIVLSTPVSLTKPSSELIKTGYIILLEPDELKSTFLNQLPIRPDSIRVVVQFELSDKSLGESEVLRKDKTIKTSVFSRKISVDRRVEVKIEPFGWESVNDISPMIDWDKNYTYSQMIFTDGKSPFPLAIVQKRDGRSRAALFNLSVKNKTLSITAGSPSIKAVPNPVINDLRFEIDNVSSGTYTIYIKNILGELKFEKRVTIEDSDVIPVDIDSLRKGSYFYILEDDNGNVLSTKRLIVLRP